MKLTLLLSALASITLAVTLVTATSPDSRLALCGDGRAGNVATASFQVPDVTRIWDFLPAMGMAPELSADKGPAFVVLFDRYTGLGLSGVLTATNVVCVVDAAGNVNVYENVAKDGLTVP